MMKIDRSLFLIAGLLTACSDGRVPQAAAMPGSDTATAPVLAKAGPTPATPPAACPPTFEAFLADILASGERQRSATADVVETGGLVEDPKDEYRLVTTRSPRQTLTFPVMPLASEHDRMNLRYDIKAGPDGAMLVEFHKEESDAFDVTYRFARTDCWKLVGMVDESL